MNHEFYTGHNKQIAEAKDAQGNEQQLLIDRIKAAANKKVQDMETDSNMNESDQSNALLLDIKNAISPHSLIVRFY